MDWRGREWLLRVRRLLSCPIKNGSSECKLVQPLWSPLWAVLLKLKIELSYGPAISLLCICPEKTKTLILKDTSNPVFIAALFIIAKTWKQLKCPSTGDWSKMYCVLSCFIHVWLCNPMDCSLPGSSVHRILHQEYWSRLPCPPPRNLPDPGIEPESLSSPALAGRFFYHWTTTWKALKMQCVYINI